ncbi:hypothetical protein HJG44_19020 [Enterovirga sp. DB1703]|uniref:Putative Flp pilus-assembly TadG-like N-terminal domain-containing protein n=2 Tax=Enterovirga aerilata TaxID=2730920 RepID=A0A849I9F6_9HYPH|nr:hypothetical protein [Enterovirga sp. DB1703]
MMFGFVGVAVDYATWTNQAAKLQQAADGAALAATRELQLGKPDDARLHAIVSGYVESKIHRGRGDGPVSVVTKRLGAQPTGTSPSAGAASARRGVQVTLSQRKNAIMSRLVTPALTDIVVDSVALVSNGTQICVIGLDESAADTIRLADRAKLAAPNCSVYANSVNPVAVRSENNAQLTSKLTCSAGGYRQSSSLNFQPSAPMTDCPKVPDPLVERPPPPVGSCLFTSLLRLERLTRTLLPGTYCGGLVIDKGAQVTMLPGIYVIKDGPLIVGPGGLARGGGDDDDDDDDDDDEGGGGAANKGFLRGNNVGIYFTGTVKPEADGKTRVLKFMKDSVVELTAPRDGPMAGLLIHEDRNAPPDRRFEVLSDMARRLVGTIYIPKGIFSISANQSVADQSEYTAIVTKRLELLQGPNLVLNTRYGDTDVPVPEGIGPNGAVRLER